MSESEILMFLYGAEFLLYTLRHGFVDIISTYNKYVP